MVLLNSTAFEVVFDEHGSAVFSYLLRRTTRETAEDLLSETFLTFWRKHGERDMPEEPLPWLLAIARRLLANQRRSEARRTALHERMAREPVFGHGDLSEQLAGSGALEALARLSERDREVLLLDAWEQLPGPEAARVLGCREGNLSPTLAPRPGAVCSGTRTRGWLRAAESHAGRGGTAMSDLQQILRNTNPVPAGTPVPDAVRQELFAEVRRTAARQPVRRGRRRWRLPIPMIAVPLLISASVATGAGVYWGVSQATKDQSTALTAAPTVLPSDAARQRLVRSFRQPARSSCGRRRTRPA